jgi:ATP-dependent RNA helicase DeaD
MNFLMIRKYILIEVVEQEGREKWYLSFHSYGRDTYRIKQIERMNNTRFHKLDIPAGKDVCRKQFFHFIDKLLQAEISHGEYETYLPLLKEKFAHIDKEEIMQRVAALEFNRFLQYYENAADLNMRTDARRERNGTPERDRSIKTGPRSSGGSLKDCL